MPPGGFVVRLFEFKVAMILNHAGLARGIAFELDAQTYVVHRVGVAQGIFEGNLLVLVQIEQRLVEGLHARPRWTWRSAISFRARRP